MSETPPTWEDIAQVGDIERWVVARLRQLGLLDEATDPAKLSGAALHQYKARREEERRVRKQLRQQAWAAFRQAHLVHLGADVFHHDTPDQDRYDLPDPDLLIRTAGESRISNFLLWQISYAELYVTQTLWPDFGAKDLHAAIRDFSKRTRKFGAVV